MNLTFNKTPNGWVAEFNAPTHFNLHLERKDTGRLDLYRKTSGSNYDYIYIPHQIATEIVDVDIPVAIGSDYKIVCGSEPIVAIITFVE